MAVQPGFHSIWARPRAFPDSAPARPHSHFQRRGPAARWSSFPPPPGPNFVPPLTSALAPRALVASNVTGAVLMRLIARYRPTMLLDEADTWLRSDDADMRGLINAGEYRRIAVVYRCAPDSHEPQAIPCFAARAIAMIGRPPATIVDRSLVIGLRRKRADESVARMRLDTLDETHRETRRRWRRWADDHAATIREAAAALAEDAIPAALVSDRARAHWRPLLAIADAVGGELAGACPSGRDSACGRGHRRGRQRRLAA